MQGQNEEKLEVPRTISSKNLEEEATIIQEEEITYIRKRKVIGNVEAEVIDKVEFEKHVKNQNITKRRSKLPSRLQSPRKLKKKEKEERDKKEETKEEDDDDKDDVDDEMDEPKLGEKDDEREDVDDVSKKSVSKKNVKSRKRKIEKEEEYEDVQVNKEEKNLNKMLRYQRVPPKKFMKTVLKDLSDKHKQAIKKIGFGAFLELDEPFYADSQMIENLLKNFDSKRCCLVLPGRKEEIFFDESDVHMTYGLPIGSIKIHEPPEVPNEKWEKFLQNWRKGFGLQKGAPTNKQLINRMEKVKEVDKKRKKVSNEFIWNFLVGVVNSCICLTNNKALYIKFLYSCMDTKKIVKLDWCTFVKDHLMESCKECQDGKSYFTGPLIFFMVTSFDRVQRKGLEIPREVPLISLWNKERIHMRIKSKKDLGFGQGKVLKRLKLDVDLGIENYIEDQTLAAWISAYRKRSKTEKYSASPLIPSDIIFNILVFLPATVLHKIMRYVCKEWNDIISDPIFIRAHLVCSSLLSSGVVLQNQAEPQWAYCLNTTGLKQLSIHEIPFPATVLDSCDGLLLLHDKTNPQVLHVMNLLTKAKLSLPPLTGVRILATPYAVLAFTPSSRQYKVVVVYVSLVSETGKPVDVLGFRVNDLSKTVRNVQLMVCTVAVDKTWRTIDCHSMTMNEDADMSFLSQRTLMVPPISRAGFVYWYPCIFNFGLALDVDSETMYRFPAPEDFAGDKAPKEFIFRTKTGMGLMNANDLPVCQIWEMVDPKSGTWVRGRDFNSRDMYCRLQSVLHTSKIGGSRPWFSLEHEDLLLSTPVDDKYDLVCYNRKTGYIWSFPLQWPSQLYLPHFHINSLLSPKG